MDPMSLIIASLLGSAIFGGLDLAGKGIEGHYAGKAAQTQAKLQKLMMQSQEKQYKSSQASSDKLLQMLMQENASDKQMQREAMSSDRAMQLILASMGNQSNMASMGNSVWSGSGITPGSMASLFLR